MDDAQRTASAAVEIPPDLIPVLRSAAREGVERATEYNEYSEEVHDKVYEAARLWGVITHGTPTSCDIAALADYAVRWNELPDRSPTSLDLLDALYDQLSTIRELMVLRDTARGACPLPDDHDTRELDA